MATSSTTALADLLPRVTPTFTPASSCTDDIYYPIFQEQVCRNGDGDLHPCRYWHIGPTTSTSDCFPSAWSPLEGSFISPGVCPQGYEVACQPTGIGKSVTTATCCPLGYECQTGTVFEWLKTDLCFQAMKETITYVYTTSTPGGKREVTETTGGGKNTLNAFGMEIRWAASDFETTSTSSSNSIPETSASIPIASQSSQNGTSDDSIRSDSLTAGAIVGIVVGAVAGILIALGLLFLLYRRRRQRQQTTGDVVIVNQAATTEKVSELDGLRETVELEARRLGTHTYPAELQSSTTQFDAKAN